jgi:DNA repair exonuclease SbcCD ATPase subunit
MSEEIASRALLEKAIAKNSSLEREVRELRKSYNAEKTSFEATLKKKEWETRALTDKLRRNIETVQSVKGEHPSWEMLYKTLKKRSEEKLFEITQALSEKATEIIRLKETCHDLREAAAAAAKQAPLDLAEHTEQLQCELKEVRSQLEEKDMLARTLGDNISSLLGKNEEFQHIMLDERRDAEEQNKKFCDEIGQLRAELNWRDQEMKKIKGELADAINHAKEFEAVEEIKSREQEELYSVMSSKLKILSGYFENLEARVKFAFRKA